MSQKKFAVLGSSIFGVDYFLKIDKKTQILENRGANIVSSYSWVSKDCTFFNSKKEAREALMKLSDNMSAAFIEDCYKKDVNPEELYIVKFKMKKKTLVNLMDVKEEAGDS